MTKSIIIAGIIGALLWGFLTLMTLGLPLAWCAVINQGTGGLWEVAVNKMANGFYYDNLNKTMPTEAFLVVFGVMFAGYAYLIRRIPRQPIAPGALMAVVFFSVAFRLIALAGEPIHENDIYRYLWDGKSAVHGINPFKYAPADLFMYEHGYTEDYYDPHSDEIIRAKKWDDQDRVRLDRLLHLRDQNVEAYQRIGHWWVPTIYPPVAQAVFALGAWIRLDGLIVLKGIFLLFDLGVLWIIIRLLQGFGLNPCMSLVYGWSPLVIKEFANSGHYDAVPIFFTLLSVWLFIRNKSLSGSIVLALATLSKFFSGVLLPMVHPRLQIRHYMLFAAVLGLSYWPYFVWNDTGVGGVFMGLHIYNRQWAYNASLFAVVRAIQTSLFPDGGLFWAKMIVGGLYVIFLGGLFRAHSKDDGGVLKKSFWAIAVLFIINPVGDPWYFCWIIPFLCFLPYRSWILLSGLMAVSYLNFQTGIPIVNAVFLKIPVISWIIYIPFILYLIFEIRRSKSYIPDLQAYQLD